MGMFDTVVVTCPSCGTELEFQSKAGACQMSRYPADTIPSAVAADLDGCSQTCSCGETVTLLLPVELHRVSMVVATASALSEHG